MRYLLVLGLLAVTTSVFASDNAAVKLEIDPSCVVTILDKTLYGDLAPVPEDDPINEDVYVFLGADNLQVCINYDCTVSAKVTSAAAVVGQVSSALDAMPAKVSIDGGAFAVNPTLAVVWNPAGGNNDQQLFDLDVQIDRSGLDDHSGTYAGTLTVDCL